MNRQQRKYLSERARARHTYDKRLICIAKCPASAAQDDPAVKAYTATMQTMHKDMMVNYTGDADVDFVRGMIPHHQAPSTWPRSR